MPPNSPVEEHSKQDNTGIYGRNNPHCIKKKNESTPNGLTRFFYLLFVSTKSNKKLAGRTHKIQFRTAHFTTRLWLEQIKCFLRTERIL